MDRQPEIVGYRDAYQPAFDRLNREWIERYFWVEEIDERILSNPRETIVDAGGEVLFAIDGDRILGTCAVIASKPGVYELSKMAVDEKARGRGLGDRLLLAAIAWARDRGAHEVFLESNTVLEPAIRLYEKHGFVTTRLGPGDEYARSNIRMALDLRPAT